MNQYKSLRKTKNSVFGILLALLILFELCSLVMLGTRLNVFSNRSNGNVFSLVHSDARTTVRQGYVDEEGNFTFPETAAILPAMPGSLSVVRPLDEFNQGEISDFQIYDGNTAWQGVTNVEIFKVSYQNGEERITVDGGADKVIAPGTENQYAFTLDNSGKHPLDYTMTVRASFGNSQYSIPVSVRLRTASGEFAVGSADTFEDVLQLNRVYEESALGAGRQHTYILDWKWDFEGDDVYDTLLGNLAASGEELSLAITIETVATQSIDDDCTSGDLPPTGDDSSTFRWFIVAILSMAGIFALIQIKRRQPVDEI